MLVTLLLALIIDILWGDPPNTWHPVAWMGRLIKALRTIMPRRGRLAPLMGGGVIAWGGAVAMIGIGYTLSWLLALLPRPLQWLIRALILKSTFSLAGLVRAGREIEAVLKIEDLPRARQLVSWHLVSRDTSALTESQVAAATIESLAENLSDGVIAPLFFYMVGGLPAALAYRYLNTCDAMLGYRNEEYEWLGKIPARTDDVMNLVPARLTAVSILGVIALRTLADYIQFDPRARKSLATAFTTYIRDHAQTASPNAGHPMSAMAGGLGIVLQKVDHYTLGEGLAPPRASDIRRAITILYSATALGVGGLYVIATAIRAFRTRGHSG